MSDQRRITDGAGRLLGHEARTSSGGTRIYDRTGRPLGEHNPATDQVRGNDGRLVGYGRGLLGSLLPKKP